MAISNSELGAQQLLSVLTGENGSLALSYLQEIDSRKPTRDEAAILKKAYSTVKKPVLSFQLKKSLRLAAFRLKGAKFKVSLEGMEKLLNDTSRLDDLALAIATVETAEAFLAADIIRSSEWQNFPAEILPSFCQFFKKHGNIRDSNSIQELTRHPDPIIITSALAALEKIDPENLQSIIIPLLNSPQTQVKAQAIQAFYRWNKHQALQHLLKMLFSKKEQDVILALHHANYFPYPELESHLIRLLTEVSSPPILMRISQILKNNANINLPFRIYWVNRSLSGQHKSLVKGILLGVVRSLADKKIIEVSAQEYLNDLKEKVRKEELKLIKESCKIEDESDFDESDSLLPALDEPEKAQPEKHAAASEKPVIKVPKKDPQPGFSDYENLKPQEKVKFITRLPEKSFKENKNQLVELLKTSKNKELAAVIKTFGKYGSEEDAELLEKHLKSENPDVLCAAIKTMGKLDTEQLCLYLPQYMQDKNGKIRMTATRTFVTIDRESIRSLLTSLLTSPNVKQRTLGISTSMLVDFNIVRQPLLDCLVKENSIELLEKIGMVLAANPDRELLYFTYKVSKNPRPSMKQEFEEIVNMIAQKLSVVLNKINTAEELIAEAEKIYEEEREKEKKEKEARQKSNNKEKEAVDGAEIGITEEQLQTEDNSVQAIFTSSDQDAKAKRAKATVIVWVLVAVAWGGAIALYLVKFLTGE
ncbi:MAG: HEAT repeat domain-containing protein [Candidatus Rifleibacteriota bacterium]